MTQNIQQWLAEIRTLQNQVAELRQARDEAYGSAANWRRLYETEARQRREDITELNATIAQLQNSQSEAPHQSLDAVFQNWLENRNDDSAIDPEQFQAELSTLSTDQLIRLLVQALTEYHQLKQDLEQERSDHTTTRQSLMGALGDTVDLLTKERTHHQHSLETTQPLRQERAES